MNDAPRVPPEIKKPKLKIKTNKEEPKTITIDPLEIERPAPQMALIDSIVNQNLVNGSRVERLISDFNRPGWVCFILAFLLALGSLSTMATKTGSTIFYEYHDPLRQTKLQTGEQLSNSLDFLNKVSINGQGFTLAQYNEFAGAVIMDKVKSDPEFTAMAAWMAKYNLDVTPIITTKPSSVFGKHLGSLNNGIVVIPEAIKLSSIFTVANVSGKLTLSAFQISNGQVKCLTYVGAELNGCPHSSARQDEIAMFNPR